MWLRAVHRKHQISTSLDLWGNSPVTDEFPSKRAVTRNIFPFDDGIMCMMMRFHESLHCLIEIITLPEVTWSIPLAMVSIVLFQLLSLSRLGMTNKLLLWHLTQHWNVKMICLCVSIYCMHIIHWDAVQSPGNVQPLYCHILTNWTDLQRMKLSQLKRYVTKEITFMIYLFRLPLDICLSVWHACDNNLDFGSTILLWTNEYTTTMS